MEESERKTTAEKIGWGLVAFGVISCLVAVGGINMAGNEAHVVGITAGILGFPAGIFGLSILGAAEYKQATNIGK